MKETAVFTIAFDFDLNKLKKLLPELDNIIKELPNRLPDPAEIISKSAIADIPNLQNVIQSIIAKEVLQRVGFAIGGLILEQIIEHYDEEIMDFLFKRQPTDMERLKNLETDTIESRRQARIALEDVEAFGEKPNAVDINGLLLDKQFLEERISLLNALLEKIAAVEEELKSATPKLKAGVPEQPEIPVIPVVPRIPIPIGNITVEPQIDFIKPLEEELKKILEGGNKAIDERSQLVPLLENAYASLEGPTSNIILNHGLMTDAMKNGTIGAIALGREGIDPLTGKTSEFSNLFGEMVTSVGDGAVVLDHTKEKVAGLGSVTAETAETVKDLDKNALAGVTDRAGRAEETLGSLNSTTGNLTDQNNNLVASQDGVSVAMDDTGASAEELGKSLEQVENSGGFFEGMKQGFIDFVKNVERNSELMADFFANTLSQMSQSFSDLFFNVLTGRFDDLKDLAKQAFEAILRAFLDLVSAIATRQIVISIAGAFGFDTKGAKATDALGLGKDALGIAGDALGAGSAAAGAAGSIATGGAVGIQTGAEFASVVDVGGTIGALPTSGGGFLAGLSGALPYIGAAIAAAAILIPLLSGLFKKTPRLDVDFDSVKTELGRRAATISEILDEDFFADNIAQISVKRKAGLGVGGDEGIKKLIQEKLEETIEGIQDIIAKLPTDLFRQLNETLLNAEIDIDTVIAGERLLEFDAKGKKIAEKFQQFIEGELPAKLFAGIRESFFDPAFQALGVSAEASQDLIDQFLADMEAAGSREARAQVGQEFIDRFSAFVDAFNIVSGNVNDSIGQTIQTVNNLSATLGFEAVPSIDALRESLASMIENAEIDPETVQAYADLRNAMVSLTAEIVSSITGIVGKINQLNSTIVSLGGAAVDTSGFLNSAADQIQSFLNDNAANLSLSEQEGFLDQLLGVANDLLAQEQAAFEQAQRAAQEAAERAAEAQRAAIEGRIDGLNREKERIEEAFDKRIEALNEELRVAEGFAALTESIRQTLDSIVFSPESVLTGVEQVNALQANIGALQAELAGTSDPDRQIEIVGRLEEAFKTLFDAAGEAFGVNSPEFVAIFDQVTGGLSGLADMTESRARTVEEINAEIERLTAEQNSQLASIDAKIQSAQDQLSAIGTENVQATFQASDRVKELFEYIRTEYTRILEERMAQLGEISEFGFQSEVEGLGVIAAFMEENLVTLREQGEEAGKQTGYLQRIAEAFESIAEFQHGSGGVRDFGRGTFAVLHGKEAVVTMAELVQMRTGIVSQFAEALTGSVGHIDSLAGKMAGGGIVSGLAARMAGDGLISGFAGRLAGEAERNEMSVEINVNVNGGSGASAASLGNEIENMLVRSIRQGGRLRSVIQEAGARRMG